MPKKILILNWRSPFDVNSGGAEKVTLKYVESLGKLSYRVVWLASKPHKRKKEVTLPANLEVVELGSSLSIYLLAPFVYWFKFAGRFDVVIDQIHGLPFLTPLWAYSSKKLAFIHEVAQEIWDEMFPFPLNKLGKLFEKIYFWFYKSTPFLTVSSSTAADLVKFGIPRTNITVIPNGLDMKPIPHPLPKAKTLTLLFVGRLVKMKGIEEAIKVVDFLTKTYPQVRMYVVGQGSPNYVKRLNYLVQQLNLGQQIVFLGFLPESKKIRFYQKAHFLIHTSVREGFGLVVLEANSQGTPAIVYNSAGLRDVVKNGVNGFQVPKGDYHKMAETIIRIFQDQSEYQALCQSSIKYVLNFKWPKFQKKFMRLIKDL